MQVCGRATYTDLLGAGAVSLEVDATSNNLGGEDKIVEDGIVHRGEGEAAGAGGHVALGGSLDLALGDEDDMGVGELLLELLGKSLLDLTEAADEAEGVENHVRVALGADGHLLHGVDVEGGEGSLERGVVGLELVEVLGHVASKLASGLLLALLKLTEVSLCLGRH